MPMTTRLSTIYLDTFLFRRPPARFTIMAISRSSSVSSEGSACGLELTDFRFSPYQRSTATTCSTISFTSRLRFKPLRPLAQNLQP